MKGLQAYTIYLVSITFYYIALIVLCGHVLYNCGAWGHGCWCKVGIIGFLRSVSDNLNNTVKGWWSSVALSIVCVSGAGLLDYCCKLLKLLYTIDIAVGGGWWSLLPSVILVYEAVMIGAHQILYWCCRSDFRLLWHLFCVREMTLFVFLDDFDCHCSRSEWCRYVGTEVLGLSIFIAIVHELHLPTLVHFALLVTTRLLWPFRNIWQYPFQKWCGMQALGSITSWCGP